MAGSVANCSCCELLLSNQRLQVGSPQITPHSTPRQQKPQDDCIAFSQPCPLPAFDASRCPPSTPPSPSIAHPCFPSLSAGVNASRAVFSTRRDSHRSSLQTWPKPNGQSRVGNCANWLQCQRCPSAEHGRCCSCQGRTGRRAGRAGRRSLE